MLVDRSRKGRGCLETFAGLPGMLMEESVGLRLGCAEQDRSGLKLLDSQVSACLPPIIAVHPDKGALPCTIFFLNFGLTIVANISIKTLIHFFSCTI